MYWKAKGNEITKGRTQTTVEARTRALAISGAQYNINSQTRHTVDTSAYKSILKGYEE